MNLARVIYKGPAEKIGRFNKEINTGDMIALLPSEYRCVQDDDRFEFHEWTPNRTPSHVPAEEVVEFLAGEGVEAPAQLNEETEEPTNNYEGQGQNQSTGGGTGPTTEQATHSTGGEPDDRADPSSPDTHGRDEHDDESGDGSAEAQPEPQPSLSESPAEGREPVEEEEEEYLEIDSYDELTVAQLNEVINDINKDEGATVVAPKSTKKKDLVAALEKWDETN